MASPRSKFTIDDKKFRARLQELAESAPKNARKIIDGEGRRILEEWIKRTKPGDRQKMQKRIKTNIVAGHALIKRGTGNILSRERFYDAWRKGQRWAYGQRLFVRENVAKAWATNQMKHRGFLCAGMLSHGNPLGAKRGMTNEIKKFIGTAPGDFKRTDNRGKYLITIINKVKHPTSRDLDKVILACLKARYGAMTQQMKRIKEGKKYRYS